MSALILLLRAPLRLVLLHIVYIRSGVDARRHLSSGDQLEQITIVTINYPSKEFNIAVLITGKNWTYTSTSSLPISGI